MTICITFILNIANPFPLQQKLFINVYNKFGLGDTNVWMSDSIVLMLETSALTVLIYLPTKHSSIRGKSLDMCGNVYCCKGRPITFMVLILILFCKISVHYLLR